MVGYYSNRSIGKQEEMAMTYIDRSYPSRRETLEYYLEDLTNFLASMEKECPHDRAYSEYGGNCCSTGRYRYYEVLWAPDCTKQDVLAAIEEVRSMIQRLDEQEQLKATETAAESESPDVPGQISLIGFLPLFPVFAGSFTGSEV